MELRDETYVEIWIIHSNLKEKFSSFTIKEKINSVYIESFRAI